MVLILIVVDYGLVPQSDACKRLVTLVLILVVMEDGLLPDVNTGVISFERS